jgi:glucokinase-like ROK family protein
VLGRVDDLFTQLLAVDSFEVWGVGIGLPGPVEFRTGQPVAPPIMPGWDGFDVRSYFTKRYDAPVWVDNEVNTMALGELRSGLAVGTRDMIYVKIGTGIGAGLVSGGRLHRGTQGCAGDIGHIAVGHDEGVICRCGQRGCLEAVAGGAALARDGSAAAASGRSRFLAELAADGRELTAEDVARAARHGDPVSVELITRSARLVGETLSGMVNFFNPSLILLGGGVSAVGDLYLATVRQVILRRSLPLATRALRIERSPLSDQVGLLGAAFMVVDELLSRERLGRWIDRGTPAGQPELTDQPAGPTKSQMSLVR